MGEGDLERLAAVYSGVSLDGVPDDLLRLLPRHKLDVGRVEELIAVGHPAVEPVLPHLLTWLQDLNWPVGSALAPFLAESGRALLPALRKVLESDDELWKLWVLRSVVSDLAPELIGELNESLRSVAESAAEEDVRVAARHILERQEAASG